MEPRAAWGAAIVLALVLAAGAWPVAEVAPRAAPCEDARLVELRGAPGDDGAFGPPRLVCDHGRDAALARLGCQPETAGDRKAPDGSAAIAAGCPVSLGMSAPTSLLLGRAVDVNSADEEDLAALPGIGPGLARRIVATRERDGPFAALGDLRRVKGLGSSRIRAVEGWAVAGNLTSR